VSTVDALDSPRLVRSLSVDGIGHLAVPVTDLPAAAEFYKDLGFTEFGTDVIPQCGAHSAFRSASGQMLALVPTTAMTDLRETGVHQAYRVSAAEREAIRARFTAKGIVPFTYKEDRPAEENDNFYLFDPSGNRVQLVVVQGAKAGGVLGIDHAAVQVADMLWAEKFYGEDLGLAVDHRIGWKTGDYVRARKWASGEEDMAPGTRRLDQRYTVMVDRKTVPRCNMQLFYRLGDAVIGIYLANKHFQESPEEQAVGTPRIAFAASRDELARAAKLLAATGRVVVEGPVVHPASSVLEASVYFRDPGGNFIELCTPRRR
jgi:catechol 2,3-dioxygenase-like lactoylglutathione lyase family enzyme